MIWSPPRARSLSSSIAIKAATLLNFTKFVEWPPGSFPGESAPLSICILGADPFGATLDQTVHEEVANGRSLVIQRIGRDLPCRGPVRVLFDLTPGRRTCLRFWLAWGRES